VKQDPARSRAAGDYLTHRFNPELGIGRVSALDGRALIVEFPRSGATLRLAADTDALVPVDLSPGRPVRISATLEHTTIAARLKVSEREVVNMDRRLRGDVSLNSPVHAERNSARGALLY